MSIDNSIESYREIICENPYKEIWNQLRYFTDVDSVDRKIRERLSVEEGQHEDNTKKQAQQISYSIMQADNYFRSAQEVDLSVKPNLIYYGISSLANTVILYNNCGEFSLDYLREKKKEKHHGLEERLSSKARKKNASTEEILEGISCKIYKKQNEPGKHIPYGHFKNFYNSIIPECIFLDVKTFIQGKKGWLEHRQPVYNADKRPIGDLTSADFALIDMLGFLPDVTGQLTDNNIQSNLCPGQMRLTFHEMQQDQGVGDQKNYGEGFIFINGVSTEKEEYFKKLYLENKAISLEDQFSSNLYFSYDSRRESDLAYMPDMTQDLSGAIYFIYEVEKYVQELANFYICFFCTGMLCRYYPDHWMRWLEKNVGFRNLMNRLCSVAIRKFPNLILNQLTQRINHFHL